MLSVRAVNLAVRLSFSTLSLISIALPSKAQVLYGSIVGTVVDPGSSAIPDAAVRVVSSDTSQTREVVSDASGLFSFASLPGGTYEITITKPGFQTYVLRGLTVNADATVRVNATLAVGKLEQTVEVSAQTATLQADSAEVRSEIGTKTLEAVPVPIGRNYQNLLVTVPGVMPPANQQLCGG